MVFFFDYTEAAGDRNLLTPKNAEQEGDGTDAADGGGGGGGGDGAPFKVSDCIVYMGADQFENDALIEWGLPTDIWFHVDRHSSAHVYLRLPMEAAPDCPEDGRSASYMDLVPESVIEEMCQLVKNNSIAGCKEASTKVVFTPWGNLRKDQGAMNESMLPR